MSNERVLNQLMPPPNGLRRLVARRDAVPAGHWIGLPLAAAASLAVVVFMMRPEPRELTMPWSGGRLVAQRSEGVGVQHVEGSQAVALPSEDPRVRIYWLQDSSAGK